MSRASTYRTAAADLRRASVQFAEVAGVHHRTDATVIGAVGSVATIHDRSVDTVERHLATAVDEAARLAVECDRRADVCADYEREVAAWSSLPWIDRLTVPVPVPPARWVLG